LEAIAGLDKGDVLLVAKRDRLGRDPIAVAMIEAAIKRKGARVVSAAGEGTESDDPTAVLMRRIVDAFSEYERLVIGARTKAGLQAKKRRGERVGQIPLGHDLADDRKRLVANPDEQQAITTVRTLRAEGRTIRGIVDEMNARGIPTKENGRWHIPTVARILKTA
jgi:DNA invertase Pin-like site-specific DNA recombinase